MRLTAVDSQSIFDSLSSIVEKQLGLSWLDVVAVCFDGAATMAGCSNGVQSKCKEINSKIFYVHCHAHCLNLVLVDSIGRKNRIVFDFFEKVAKEINLTLKTLKSISTTRWACRFEAVAAVKNNYLAIISAIQKICDTTKIPDVRSKSRGLLMQLQTFEFIFALNMLHPLLLLIVKVNSCLQAENLDLLNSLNMIKSLKLSISQLRSDDNLFKKVYNETVECCTETGVIIPQVKKRKISSKIDQSSENQYFACTKEEEMKVTSFNVVLDDLLNGLNDRFNQETLKLILTVTNILKLEPSQEDLLYLNNVFGIDSEQIQVEIMLLKNIPNIPSGTSSKTLHQ
ncbi:zinc finger MYM-type protein 1-like [Acyrthosiphon pisum]|uniref:Zinc finger MYM-type protein 1-like n=1 Tax=Acyrthosiphon pisum TaxID=7029 RepID=A0A8R2B629_ACYPI|nr:zinc finger MYM-type protein 1-like [Acyrthosiphon pisum]|eukprot:XP_008183440.1 PREDICTED: zinc finger MYM-type protein 1-like [Acyrthosiphon pisum]